MGQFMDVINESNKNVGGMLAESKKELTEKGYIEQDLLSWVMIKISLFKYENMFFGIKNGELMVLPIINIREYKLNEVKYYKKEDIKQFKMISFGKRILLELKRGGKMIFTPVYVGGGFQNLTKIMSIINQKKNREED